MSTPTAQGGSVSKGAWWIGLGVASLSLVACGGAGSSGSTTPPPATPTETATTTAAPTPRTSSPRPTFPAPGPVSNIEISIADQGPDAELQIAFDAPDLAEGADEDLEFVFEGDLEDSFSDSPGWFFVEEWMLGETFEVSITTVTAFGTSEPVTISFEVPADAMDFDTSGYEELSSREWALLLKDPDAYADETYVVFGEITQFDSATGSDSFRADAAYYNAGSNFFYEGENSYFSGDEEMLREYVEGDIVKMYVTVLGSYSYETTSGGLLTVPEFYVDSIERLG